MQFILKPTLEQMTLVKIAKELWNHKNIRRMIEAFEIIEDFEEEWQEVENQVVKNVPHLQLFESLHKNLLHLMSPIGRQIRAWCMYHRENCQISKLPKEFCWTPKGTIDRNRTAKMLVKDEDIDVESRYKLACINCLEDDIPELWKQVPEQQKEFYYTKKPSTFYSRVYELMKFWTYPLVGQKSMLDEEVRRRSDQSNPHVHVILPTIFDGNQVATKFLFNKLNSAEKRKVLADLTNNATLTLPDSSVNSELRSGVFHFLLSQMTEDQQIKTLTKEPYFTFNCFLDWSFQPFFLSSVEPVMSLISGDDHIEILDCIVTKIVSGWTDFDYRQLFRNFWRLIPLSSRRRSLRHFGMLYKLFKGEEKEFLETLFNNADTSDKQRLLMNEKWRDVCVKMVDEKRWRSLEFLTKLCDPSKELMVGFKEGLMERHAWRRPKAVYGAAKYKRRWKMFSSLFDDLIAKKSEKRKIEKDGNNPEQKATLRML